MSDSEIFYFDELPSTNQKLKELVATGDMAEFSVVMAKHQIAGRGQMGNSWESEAGKNLTFSVNLNPLFLLVQEQFLLSKAVSVALVETLEQFGVKQVKVKWPNDIYVGNGKVAGILIENSIMGATIEQCTVGIGLNVNQSVFVSDAPNPLSMAMAIGHELNLHLVFNAVMENLCRFYVGLADDKLSVDNRYFSMLFWADGAYHPFRDAEGTFSAAIDGIDGFGRLCLLLPDGSRRWYEFKEVTYLI